MVMPSSCSVPQCLSGKRNAKARKARLDGEYVTLFSVPKDPEMLEKWRQCVPLGMKGKALQAGDKICELHFTPDIIDREWVIPVGNIGVIEVIKKDRPTLKKGAVPTENLPSQNTTEQSAAQNAHKRATKRKLLVPENSIVNETELMPIETYEEINFTYGSLEDLLLAVQMPSSYWGRHTAPNLIAFTCLSKDFYSKGVISDKAVVFEGSLTPKIILRGKKVSLHIPGLGVNGVESLSDVEKVLKIVDASKTCAGIRALNNGPPEYSSKCRGFLVKKDRCHNCENKVNRVNQAKYTELQMRLMLRKINRLEQQLEYRSDSGSLSESEDDHMYG